MCANCVSTVEVIAGQIGLAVAVGHRPVRDLGAALGIVSPYEEARRDGRTVAFLTALGLDPVEVLGAEVVARAVEPATAPSRVRMVGAWRPVQAV